MYRIPKTDQNASVNYWMIVCAFTALDHASSDLLDSASLKGDRKHRIQHIHTFANNQLNKMYAPSNGNEAQLRDTQYLCYDHVVLMQKLFTLACALPIDKLSDFLNLVDSTTKQFIDEKTVDVG